MNNLLEEAKRLVRMNSVTASGNEEIANYVVDLMKDCGLKTQLQLVMHSLEDVSKRQFNAIGILGDQLVDRKTKKGLLLCSHLDTVPTGCHADWTESAGNPFSAEVKSGSLYGLGAADSKVDFLCKLFAIDRLRERHFKQPVYLVGTCGDELGMFGARYLIKAMTLNPQSVVVGEPSNLMLIDGHKAMLALRITAGIQQIERDARGFNRRVVMYSQGLSSHGANPAGGRNAISQLFDFFFYAEECGFELRFVKFEGGDSLNKVPDAARAEFFMTAHQLEDFKRFFREYISAQGPGFERAFRAELGGLGDSGVKFLPEDFSKLFRELFSGIEEWKLGLTKDSLGEFSPDTSTVSLGLLSQRQSGIDLLLDCRLLPTQDPIECESQLKEILKKVCAKFPRVNLTVHREGLNPAFGADQNSELMRNSLQALRDVGLEKNVGKLSVSTEAAHFQQAGFDTIVFGPGESLGNIHGPNEKLLLSHVEKTVLFYQRLIERTCCA